MGRNKSLVCQKFYHVMRKDVLKRHMKLHEKQPSEYYILGESLLQENNARKNESDSTPTTSVSKLSNFFILVMFILFLYFLTYFLI